MKFLTGILLLIFSSAYANPPIVGVTYKTEATVIYLYGNRVAEAPGGLLIEFDGWTIRSTAKDQTKKLHVQEDWETHEFKVNNIKNIRVQAKDDGQFRCFLNYGYDHRYDLYFLSVMYNNVIFFHWMKPTTEKIYDGPDDIIEFEIPDKIEYSEQRIQNFLNTFGILMLSE